MRILQILHSHGYGGAENHALMLMRSLQQAGHEVLFTGPLDSWLGAACQEADIATEQLAMHGLFDIRSHVNLRRLVKRWQPAIVHGHLIRGAQYAGWVDGGQRGPIALCTAHATTAYKHMDRCRHIIAVSQAVKENLLQHGHAAKRISVIHNGIPLPPSAPQDRQQLRQELGIPDEHFAVVNVGRFIADKGQDLLVRCLETCAAPMHIYLIGDPKTEFGQHLQQQAPHERVHFLGYRQDVQRLLPAFDAYALSSRREALGLAVIEALAAGLPIVATAVGGVPEIIHDGQTGLLVAPHDPQRLAQGLNRLFHEPLLAQRLAQNGYAQFQQQLTVEHMRDQTLAVYQRCLQAAGRQPKVPT